jgi:IclR family transcriptional regulator, acetate operon repressor
MAREGTASLVQSVDRAVSVLEVLAERGPSGVTEIAGQLGVHKSTASRLISVLEDHRLVAQVTNRGKYQLGLGLIRLAGATSAQFDLVRDSQEACERLAADLRDTVNIAVLQEFWVINISQVRGPSAVSTHNWVGQLTPAHATSSGKVLLAFSGDDVLNTFLGQPLQQYTSRTVTSSRILRRQLAEVRERGYAETLEELEIGLNAVAAPIRSMDGDVAAALSVSGPSYRLAEEHLPAAAAQVRTAASEISSRLGYHDGQIKLSG